MTIRLPQFYKIKPIIVNKTKAQFKILKLNKTKVVLNKTIIAHHLKIKAAQLSKIKVIILLKIKTVQTIVANKIILLL